MVSRLDLPKIMRVHIFRILASNSRVINHNIVHTICVLQVQSYDDNVESDAGRLSMCNVIGYARCSV